VPSGDAADIFDRAVTLLVDQLERQRFAQTERARASKPSPESSRHIPAAVRRAVWRRDGGCCAFVGTERRCGERAFLELHHVEPYAVGGAATEENIELRCRAHNMHEARLFFGADVVREAGLLALTRSGPERADQSLRTLHQQASPEPNLRGSLVIRGSDSSVF
jgi:hypothetical protein